MITERELLDELSRLEQVYEDMRCDGASHEDLSEAKDEILDIEKQLQRIWLRQENEFRASLYDGYTL